MMFSAKDQLHTTSLLLLTIIKRVKLRTCDPQNNTLDGLLNDIGVLKCCCMNFGMLWTQRLMP